ncbi:MAG: glycosyltransferase family 4 protein [Armatimonadota bacterium]
MGDRVRVAFLIGNLAPYRVALLRRIAEREGIDVTVFLMSTRERHREWQVAAQGFHAKVLSGWGLPLYTTLAGPTTLFVNPTVISELVRGRFDLIVTLAWTQPYSLQALLVSKFTGVPVFLWEESIPHEPSLKKRLVMPLIRRVIQSYAGYLAASSRCIEYLASFGVERSRIFLFPQVTDHERFTAQGSRFETDQAALRRELKLPETGPAVMFVGQFIPRKGVLELLDAWRILHARGRSHGAFLVLVGGGELRNRLVEEVRRDGLESSVFVSEFKQQDELPIWYAACDIFVLPSRYDTFGVVVNEAMAAGLPIIATERVGAVGDLVKDGVNGLVVPPGDARALSSALEALIENADRRREMGRMSTELIGGWNVELAVAKFEEAIAWGSGRSPTFPRAS